MKCRERDCWSLNCSIKKKIGGYKTLIHTFTKRIEEKANNNNNNNNNNIIIIIIIIIKQKQKQETLNRRTQSKKGDKKVYPVVLLINSL